MVIMYSAKTVPGSVGISWICLYVCACMQVFECVQCECLTECVQACVCTYMYMTLIVYVCEMQLIKTSPSHTFFSPPDVTNSLLDLAS